MTRGSLVVRHAAAALLLCAAAAGLAIGLDACLGSAAEACALTSIAIAPVAFIVAWRQLAPMRSLFRALAGTVTSYRDGDFSFGLVWKRNDELGDLVAAHNALGASLREQRQALVARELLLDTMVQHTPVAMILLDPADRVAYANLAARKLLGQGRRLEGETLAAVIDRAAPPAREALDRGGDRMFAVRAIDTDDEEVFALIRRRFRLSGRAHELLLFRRVTAELRRQEVASWKKVLRVIAHELNNSLAPIVSLAHSGAELIATDRGDELAPVLATIEERARHLDRFIQGYARFAKLPAPRLEPVAWPRFIDRLRAQTAFEIDGPLPDAPTRFDPAQLEQALLNLLKNASESGSAAEDVSLGVRRIADMVRIDVCDRGAGMTDTVMASAPLPFYSTKRSGTGLGLALVREIAEAHGGRVALARRDGGGMRVTLTIPQR